MVMMMAKIADNIARVRARIAEACASAGRDPAGVRLVAVTKQRSAGAVVEAAAAGITDIGENRVEEAAPKRAGIDLPLTWHMIGHLQSRKARDAVKCFDVVQSVDSVRLARRLSRFVLEEDESKTLPILLECNVSGESAKYGWEAARWEDDAALRQTLWDDVRAVLALPGLRVMGLMTMAPLTDAMETTRPVFAGLRRLRDALANDFTAAAWVHLSMGMTDDYPVAVEEGATMVRIGRAIFETSD
ncbi:MAG: YggS family pyridoxal phosphate-dependent enzyme [Anaerolineae bacterium]|nr:YggS family pyridoxal phosphate-dependent enzyme [Anaerolineae bacterium]